MYLQEFVARFQPSDLPIEVLQNILDKTECTDDLKSRHNLALVSKAFASAMRRQQSVILSNMHLTSPNLDFSTAASLQLQCTLRGITTLQLHQISPSNLNRMISAIHSCPTVTVLKLDLKTFDDSTCKCLWRELHQTSMRGCTLTQLKHVSIALKTHFLVDFDMLHDVSNMPGRLAGITAGDLCILRMLAGHPKKLFMELPSLEKEDSDMLKLMPALTWLDIGRHTVYAPFRHTIRSQLSRTTAAAFSQANTAHCLGLHVYHGIVNIQPVQSIISWTSMMSELHRSSLLAYIAPNLQTLCLHCHHRTPDMHRLALGSALKFVDLTLVAPGNAIQVTGCPTHLQYLHIVADIIILDTSIVDAFSAQQHSPRIAEHAIFVYDHDDDDNGSTVCWTAANKLALLFGSFASCPSLHVYDCCYCKSFNRDAAAQQIMSSQLPACGSIRCDIDVTSIGASGAAKAGCVPVSF